MTSTAKFLTLALAFGFVAQQAEASASKVTVINHSNKTAACALITEDVSTHSGVTNSWYVVANGATTTIGTGFFVYCEEKGNPNVTWTDNSGDSFCVNTPSTYVNPIFQSDNSSQCQRIGGQMRPFKSAASLHGSLNWTLNP